MKKKYLIADLLIKISGLDDAYLAKTLRPYAHPTFRRPDVIIKTVKSDNFIENNFNGIRKISESQYFHEGEIYDSLIFYDEKLCRIVALVSFDKSYTDITVTICNLKKLCAIRDDKLLFNVMGIAMQYVMRMNAGFVFHSSAISSKGCGLAFSAQSGVGKSTHTAMWLEHMSDTVMVNDDTPVIRLKKNGEVYLYGSPWAGSTGINTNTSVPLKAVVFLERNNGNSISEIPAVEAVKRFLEGITPSVTGAMHLKTLDALNAVMKKTKMYLLRCNADIDAMHTVKNKIMP